MSVTFGLLWSEGKDELCTYSLQGLCHKIFTTAFFLAKLTHLQSWARDNSVATICPCFKVTKLFVIAILLYLLWLPHSDTEA